MVLPTFFHLPNPPLPEVRFSLASQLSTSNTLQSSSSVNRTLFLAAVLPLTPGMSMGIGVERPLEVAVALALLVVTVPLGVLDDEDDDSGSGSCSRARSVVDELVLFFFLRAERREWIEKGGEGKVMDEGEEDRLVDVDVVRSVCVLRKWVCAFGVGSEDGE